MSPVATCPCGKDHSDHQFWPVLCEMVQSLGETIVIATPTGAWKVPRIYIAMHGIKAPELGALADKFGWEKA
jgi:hypothetical protein